MPGLCAAQEGASPSYLALLREGAKEGGEGSPVVVRLWHGQVIPGCFPPVHASLSVRGR